MATSEGRKLFHMQATHIHTCSGVTDSRAQVGEDHLQEQDPNAVHVKLVWVVEAPKDRGQEGSHRQRGSPGSLQSSIIN